MPSGQLNRANALSQAVRHGIATVGPVAGGALVATAGPCEDPASSSAWDRPPCAWDRWGWPGRVTAHQEFATSVPIPIAYALAGFTADRLGSQTVIGACAAIIALAALAPLTVRDVRQLAFTDTGR